MTKNIGGKKKKRAAKNTFNSKREILLKEDEQEYGVVDKMLGDMRCNVLCSDSTMKICHIRGKFKRRVWINPGDVVLISLREFQDDKADIIHKYTPDEADFLKSNGEFDPSIFKNTEKNNDVVVINEDDIISFDDI